MGRQQNCMPKVKLEFTRRSFYFLGASIDSLPLSLRIITPKVLFRKALDVTFNCSFKRFFNLVLVCFLYFLDIL